MPDDADDRLRRHEEIMGGLYAMLVEIRERNQRLDATLERLDGAIIELQGFTREQVKINAGVQTTLAKLEAFMERVFGDQTNGRDA
jgi:hypothetical protein